MAGPLVLIETSALPCELGGSSGILSGTGWVEQDAALISTQAGAARVPKVQDCTKKEVCWGATNLLASSSTVRSALSLVSLSSAEITVLGEILPVGLRSFCFI